MPLPQEDKEDIVQRLFLELIRMYRNRNKYSKAAWNATVTMMVKARILDYKHSVYRHINSTVPLSSVLTDQEEDNNRSGYGGTQDSIIKPVESDVYAFDLYVTLIEQIKSENSVFDEWEKRYIQAVLDKQSGANVRDPLRAASGRLPKVEIQKKLEILKEKMRKVL